MNYLTVLISTLLGFTPFSPPQNLGSDDFFCESANLHQSLLEQSDTYRQEFQKWENEVYLHSLNAIRSRQADYTLPVVVHIVHNNGAENISDAQVIEGIQHLNEAFANTGPYDPSTGVNTNIEFCLAKRDPQGLATTGITRTISSLTNMDASQDDLAVKNLSRWDPLSYINIWLVNEICRSGSGCGVAGYAYFPSAHGRDIDGIMMEARFFGSSSANSGVQVHEMGHYLGLYHTFQGGCTNNDCLRDGDRVCDTPPDQSTARVPCNGVANSCSTDVNPGDPNNPFTTDQNDMFINYMDYGRLTCYSAFTAGQSDRMESSILTVRHSLLDSDGCQDPCTQLITADFSFGSSPVNVGTTINFVNLTSGANRYEWYIDGTLESTSPSPSYTFNTAGTYEIRLQAYNSDPNCYGEITYTIEVVCPVEASFTSGALVIELGESIDFQNTSSGANNYAWTINGMPVGSSTHLNYMFLIDGLVEVCLEASNAFCSERYCEWVVVNLPDSGCASSYFKTYGSPNVDERAECIIVSEDNNLYVAGNKGDLFALTKLDPGGEVLWQRTFDPSPSRDFVKDIYLDSDDQLLICGFGNGNFQGSGPFIQGFVMKYDPVADQIIWLHRERSEHRSIYYKIQELQPGGDYLLAGNHYAVRGASPRNCDAQMVLLDRNNGQDIGMQRSFHLGSCEAFFDFEIYNNHIYTTGRYNFWGGGESRMRGGLSRFDLNGNHQWSKLHLMGVDRASFIHGIAIEPFNDHFMVAYHGRHDGNTTQLWIHLSQVDTDGNVVWARHYQLAQSNDLRMSDIKAVPGGFLLLGVDHANGKTFLIKVDRRGNVEWAKRYGGASELRTSGGGRQLLPLGGFAYIVGRTTTFGNGDLFMLKVNLDGDIEGDCDAAEDVDVIATDYNNPYDGQHDMTQLPNPLINESVNDQARTATLLVEDQCVSECLEICDNGIDDDEDGLIDYFDEEDCPCTEISCNTPTFQACVDCEVSFTRAEEWELNTLWTSRSIGNSILTPLVGDVDNDCEPEVVTASREFDAIYILNGADGSVEYEVQTYQTTAGTTGNIAIADVDRNGMADIFIITSDEAPNTPAESHRLVRYEFNGSGFVERYRSSEQIGPYPNFDVRNGQRYSYMAINIADINSDGIPEVVIGNEVFNSISGALITEGGPLNSVAAQRAWSRSTDHGNVGSQPVLADVLPDDFCTLCGGLELVAGNMVYSIFIPAGSNGGSGAMQVEVDMSNQIEDGMVSVADFDFDGELEIVSGQGYDQSGRYSVQIWNPRTGVIYDQLDFNEYGAIGPGRIAIANLDNDQSNLEISCHVGSNLYVYSFDPASQTFNQIARTSVIDPSRTSVTVFDFNGDGENEVVYRDEQHLRILRGRDLADLVSPFYVCRSGTSIEYPVIADVNGDGQTEILVACDNFLRAVGNGESGRYWMPARKVWNQFAYVYTNVNDDLTIPLQQQAQQKVGDKIVLNSFLKQYFSPRPAAPDAVLYIDQIDCGVDSFPLQYSICNDGDLPLPAMTAVSFYGSDPQSSPAVLLGTQLLPEELLPDECTSLRVMLPSSIAATQVYAVANDNGQLPRPFNLMTDFPATTVAECNYSNNIADVEARIISPPVLDLGPDITVCDNGVFTFDAGPGFDQYLWHDGTIEQLFTAYEAGIFWVTAVDSCGGIQMDTIEVFIDSTTVIDLGPDQIICGNEELQFSVPGFDQYKWTPAVSLNCDDCSEVLANPSETTTYTLVASSANGCISTDTIRIVIADEYEQSFNATICQGDTYTFGSNSYSSAGIYADTLSTVNGCDSVLLLNLMVNAAPITPLSVGICEGEQYTFGSNVYTTSGIYEDTLQTSNGCDSIVLLTLTVDSFVTTSLNEEICDGESYSFGTQSVFSSGIYSDTLIASGGCDSLVTLSLLVHPPSISPLASFSICEGEELVVGANSYSVAGTYTDTLAAANGCDSILTFDLIVHSEWVVPLNARICEGENFVLGANMYSLPGVYSDTLLSVHNCDSIIQLTLEVDTIVSTDLQARICEGESYSFGAQLYTTEGVYTDTLSAANGCDSLLVLFLEIDPVEQTMIEARICEGETYQLGTQSYQLPGSYSDTLISAFACDSIVHLTLELAPVYNQVLGESICQGDSVFFGGQWLDADTIVIFDFQSVDGCDSIVELHVQQLSSSNSFTVVDTAVCLGEVVVFDGQEVSAGQRDTFYYNTIHACDSIIVLDVAALDTFRFYDLIEICPGDSIEVFGTFETEEGIYAQRLTAANGCDSVLWQEVIHYALPQVDFSSNMVCPGDSDGWITASLSGGTPPFQLEWANGSDSTLIQNLSPGEYALTVTDANNCLTEVLGIVAEQEVPNYGLSEIDVSCFGETDGRLLVSGAQLIFQMNGETIFDSGTFTLLEPGVYELQITDQLGCEYFEDIQIGEPVAITLNLPDEQDICVGDTILLSPGYNYPDSVLQFIWSPAAGLDCSDCPQVRAFPTSTQSYTLTLVNEQGCTSSEEVLIRVDRSRNIYIPNIFTPNGDGINDYFTLFGDQKVEQINSLRIFDRWGELIFEAENLIPNQELSGWDGRFRGEPMNNGVFVYVAEVVFRDGFQQLYTGDITLVR